MSRGSDTVVPEQAVGVTPLRDAFGRVIDYLRISVTDRCNLRCVYCMPLSLPDVAERSDLLTAEEIETTVLAATRLGFRKFRLTGGEPTVRPDILDIVRRIASVPGVADLSMTTNAVRLAELAAPLRDAGLRRVNVHVDTLDAETLPHIMRLGSLDRIQAGIEAAESVECTVLIHPGLGGIAINDGIAGGALLDERSHLVRAIEGAETIQCSVLQETDASVG